MGLIFTIKATTLSMSWTSVHSLLLFVIQIIFHNDV